MSEIQFKYFYGTESDTYTFYKIPKLLITDDYFKDISNDAKLLYGMMLERVSLSAKNGWYDEENRVYIRFGIKDAMELLRIGKNKAIKLFAELDDETGVGLIERKVQGQGKSQVIYVKSFMSEVYKSNLKEFENETSRGSDFKPLEVSEVNPNKNKYKENIRDLESNPIDEDMVRLEQEVREQLGVEALKHDMPYDQDLIEEIYELILETLLCQEQSVVIASSRYPMDLVKRKFKRLSIEHVRYVITCMQQSTSKVKNIKKYMLATLFNAPSTINAYYRAEVNHDMAVG
ncbi:Replication initiator protein A (RepA) N-terminus [Pseudobutyrivibrio sp. YE44]|uniref:DUF6017 domain-containing protein n=1 Tax=Pseudobutyrivibrio sp. YE44 TaxID=1520802 RepID=UPI00088872D2|nr:DUF6017 domain-containing protein [Pseudobutyrivibrio sp. YE44]SDB44721.1 Replication initiator protein A (RepA) N-terminus [Pseudobutyrivibrio sp. YE44]